MILPGLRLAVGLVTIIPVRPPEQVERRQARAAMMLAPVAVAPVALAAAGLGWLGLNLGLPGTLAGAVVVTALAFGTRAIHLDGLADTADGLGSARPADQALAIMRRGDIGPMGVVSLVLVLLLQSLAAGALLARPFGWLAVALLVSVARGALVLATRTGVPSARTDGLGALVAGSVPTLPALVCGVVLVAATQGLAWLVAAPWWAAPAATGAALAAAWWLVSRAVTRLGGITGDVLGAVVEVAATGLLVVATAW